MIVFFFISILTLFLFFHYYTVQYNVLTEKEAVSTSSHPDKSKAYFQERIHHQIVLTTASEMDHYVENRGKKPQGSM